MEYIMYLDEGEKKGDRFTNFYGGALVRSIHYDYVNEKLNDYKIKNNLYSEMKWSKITTNYVEKYKGLMSEFFKLVSEDKVKVRIMFQQKSVSEPRLKGLTIEQRKNEYFLLYYQFFKHAFGLQYSNETGETILIKPYFDQFPDTKEKVVEFKRFIYNLQHQDIFQKANLKINYEDITEVVSHNHVILQCVDIVTGAMWFRLNNLHTIKPEGSRIRSKRTRAKEEVYKHINRLIRTIYPNFNIGSNTATRGNKKNRWYDPYRHWLFVPNQTYQIKFIK